MDGFQAFMLAVLLALAGVAVGWWWLLIVRPLRRAWVQARPAPFPALLALQLSVGLALVLPMLGLGSALWTLLLPPIQVLNVVLPSPKVAAVMAQNAEAIAWGAWAGTAVVGTAALAGRPPLRWCLVPAMLLGALVTLRVAEARSEARMTARARELGAECLARHTFAESLGFWGEEFQFDLHASARIDGAWHGWSYRADDFYLIPEGAPKDGNGLQGACSRQM